MPIWQEFNLDLFPGRKPPTVHVSQNDHGRQRPLRAYLFLNGQPFDVPAGTVATVEGSDPLGRGFDAVSCVVGENWVQFELTEAMTGDAGPIRCKIELTIGDTLIGTGAFVLERDPAAFGIETILNDVNFIGKLAAAVGVFFTGDSSLIYEAVSTWLDGHPEATTSVEDGSITYDKLFMGEELQDAAATAETLQRKVAGMTVAARRIFMLRREIRGGIYRAPWIGSADMFNGGIANDLNELDDPKFNKRLVAVRYYAPPAEGADDGGSGADDSGEDSEDTGGGGTTPSGGDETSDDDSTDVYAYTQNTPCRAELPDGTFVTTWRRGICISFISGSAGTQLALPSGSVNICRRNRRDGVWGAWTRAVMYSEYKALADRVSALEGG